MDENFRKQMEENGADVETTLKRFMGKEAMYMKYVMKFLDDENFNKIQESLKNRDYEAAFSGAHTLKGVTANLGLNPINAAASEMSELLRGKAAADVDAAKVEAVFAELAEAYGRIRKILEENRPQA
ncbi:MAG: Hpt domain-containing protein [Lachnospiraceae bacterium]|nr:Hpt domain-containing protein [Lachnospiraceae bacterium]